MTKRYRGPSDLEVQKSIAAWMMDYLARMRVSQTQLADDLGISRATITNIKKGTFLPGFTVLVRLHFALGATLSEVLRHPVKDHTAKVAAKKRALGA